MEVSMNIQPKESGFALLITLIVVGVVLSVGLTILDLSVKQVRLSANAKESEVAFHAANAGMECARYWRKEEAEKMETGQSFTATCFGTSVGASPNTSPDPVPTLSTPSSDGDAFLYEYEFNWSTTDPRCTQVTALVASSSIIGAGTTVDNVDQLIDGYPDAYGTDMDCGAGSRCTVISVRGYNKPCPASGTFGYGTVQREVLLQF